MKEDKFYVGAKVLRIGKTDDAVVKGKIYTVEAVKKMCVHFPVLLALEGVYYHVPDGHSYGCVMCGIHDTKGSAKCQWYAAKNFRLIEPDTELSDIEVNELLDAMSEDVPNVNHNNHSSPNL